MAQLQVVRAARGKAFGVLHRKAWCEATAESPRVARASRYQPAVCAGCAWCRLAGGAEPRWEMCYDSVAA